MVTKETAYDKILQLTERFSEQIGSYKNSEYNETLTRRDFIDPFFKALGWDIDNEQGNAEAYREVIHEDKIKIGSATKAPDYSFRLAGGKRLFFVEAKKPSVYVKEEIPPAYQIRRYGWSAKLPVSIVTDFEEFAIYDCTKKPKLTDKASASRIKYLNYKEYISEFDFLWDTFSKERVLKGSFDKFVLSDTGKKGTATVDKEFLESLNEWRKLLAETISINNIKLNEDELNFAVQQTLDRIIFLRICEDRGVEPYEKLKYSLSKGNYYKNVFEYFEEADRKYNSGLFDLAKDNISGNLTIDNKILKKIIEELYYPVSPYEFSVLSVEILGSAYEQFLGKQIKLTTSHKAKIEEKPEVRKAGGVYYTPQYIVDYIVKNTVGKLVEGKTPKEVEKIKIVDPACGSGSFLIGAYQYLLEWHLTYYMQDNRVKAKVLTPDGRLTTPEKKRILINNIYGVDIDTQAVEVTKLSLLLKCMEGETLASIQQTMSFMHERILPSLENNIKSGNSLIDLDFYDGELEFGGTDRKIKPFNWQSAYPEVFKQGGFDCVIGNPPWVDLKGHPNELIDYYFKNYETTENRINLYAIFLEKGLELLNSQGFLGLIIPNSILYQSSYAKIREKILKNISLNKIIRLPDNTFEKVKAETLILILSHLKEDIECLIYDRSDKINIITGSNTKELKYINQNSWNKNDLFVFDIYTNNEVKEVLSKIDFNRLELQSLCDFTLGITPYDKYKGHTQKQISERVFHSSKKTNNTFKKLLAGSDVKRYFVSWGETEYISYGDWLGAPREKRFFILPRILIRQIVSGKPLRIYAGYCDEELYNVQSVFNLVLKNNVRLNIKYVLAIINSKLMNFYHGNKYLDLSKNLFQKILIQNCKKLPIPKIDFNNPAEIKMHDEIVKQVETMLELNKTLQTAKLQTEREQLVQHIEYTDKKIDALVYELYGLTEEEIKIVEGEK